MPDVFTKSSISLNAAQRVLEAASVEATRLGIPMSIAVVDEAGTLKAFARMEGASVLSVTVAVDKAFTAATSGFPTGGFFEFIKDDPPLLAGIPVLPRIVAFGGGELIKLDRSVLGAVGVSGGHYSQDEEVAVAGIEALKCPVDHPSA
jgi:uncharacterized protein GlcG (DUF336 family)